MAVLLGLLVALSFGAADFLGGLSSRRNTVLVVVATSQAVGLVLLALVVAVTDNDPTALDLLRGAAGGVVGLGGLLLLYRGLAVGAMSIVAPVTAVGAAILPLAWGLATGERPGARALLGVVLTLAAVTLVSSGPEATAAGSPAHLGQRRELGLALGAGGAFGMVFVLFGASSDDTGPWPAVAARAAAVIVLGVVLLIRGRWPRLATGTVRLTIGAGMLDASANAVYLVAIRDGLVSLVAVLGALYPAATVLLARLVLHERVRRRQQFGLLLALVGVALIANG